MHNLQRTVGNQAVHRLLHRPVAVQRVGGEKVGFVLEDPSTDPEIAPGQALLKQQWEKIREAIHTEKVDKDAPDVESAAQEMIKFRTDSRNRDTERTEYEKKRLADPTAYPDPVDTAYPRLQAPKKLRGGFSQYYYARLTGKNRANQLELLKKSAAVSSGKLKIDGNAIRYSSAPSVPFVLIATLKTGQDAFVKKTYAVTDTKPTRDVYEKLGVSSGYSASDMKQYIQDDRGVVTRRYAYVEKNYWQMMEFFMTHHHDGRFQSYMRAAGEKHPNLYEARDPDVNLVIPGATHDPTATLSREQMAMAHQKLGSGPQQRGVSLTSTPKVGVTYVNTGENFRTKEGFRMKIDLARIPTKANGGPLLINHYSHGGVIEQPAHTYDMRRRRGQPSKYPYRESSVHARELYLEYLKPEWVVEIEFHPDLTIGTKLDESSPRGTHGSLIELAASQFGGTDYKGGFNHGLAHDTKPSTPTNKNFDNGFTSARNFVRGWTEGHDEHTRLGSGDAAAASTAGVTLAQYIYDQTMSKNAHESEYDMFRIGYLQGRRGAPLITSHAGLG